MFSTFAAFPFSTEPAALGFGRIFVPHVGAASGFGLPVGTRPAVPGKSDTAATRGSRGRTGVFLLRLLERFQPLSDAFLLTLCVQLCKLLLVKLLDGELNGQKCVQKASILFSTILCDDACVLCLNQPSFDQLGHIFAYRVRAHIDGASNCPVACMALICRPILNVHQVAVDRQCARFVEGLDIRTIAERVMHALFEALAMRFEFSLQGITETEVPK